MSREIRDSLRFDEAARRLRVRVKDVDRAVLDQGLEAFFQAERLLAR